MSIETVSALERGARRWPHRETIELLADALALERSATSALSRARWFRSSAAQSPSTGFEPDWP
jgi:hypothetical protein